MAILLQEAELALDALQEAQRAVEKQERLARAERRLAAALRRMFKQQEEIYLPLILSAVRQVLQEAHTPAIDWDRLFSDVELSSTDKFIEEWQATGNEALGAGQSALLADLDIATAFNLPNPRAEEYLRDYGAKLVRRVNSTTKAALRSALTEGLRAGEGVDLIAARLRRVGRSFRVPKPQRHIRDRAELIAATELAFAYERGGYLGNRYLRRAGITLEKRLLAVNDGRVDPLCASHAARGWIPEDEPFGAVVHPPLHPACRCATAYRWPQGAQPTAPPPPPPPPDDPWANPENFEHENSWGNTAMTRWADKVQQPALRGMTNTQRDSLQRYQGIAYRDLNKSLRDRVGLSPNQLELQQHLDAAIGKASLPSAVVLYRGTGSGRHYFGGSKELANMATAKQWTDATLGRTFTDDGYFSTALSREQSFGGVKLVLTAPKGYTAVPISQATTGVVDASHKDASMMTEAELLLSRGTRYVVDKTEVSTIMRFGSEVQQVTLYGRILPPE